MNRLFSFHEDVPGSQLLCTWVEKYKNQAKCIDRNCVKHTHTHTKLITVFIWSHFSFYLQGFWFFGNLSLGGGRTNGMCERPTNG